jgi:hypothetical protein
MPNKLPILATLALTALLLAAGTAQAGQLVLPGAPIALDEEVEFEAEEEGEEESEETECEETAEELEEEEITLAEAKEICDSEKQRSKPGPGGILPEECVVRTFNSSAVADSSRNRIELTTHYTTFEPTPVTIDYRIGSSRLDTAKRHLGASGVIHLDKHLSDSQTAKLEHAHKLQVEIQISPAPSRCQRYFSDSAEVQHR